MKNIDLFNVNKVSALEKEVAHLKRQLTRKTNLHNKTADRLATERMKRRHFKGRTLILQSDVDVLEQKIQGLFQEASDDNKRIGEMIAANGELHAEIYQLKNDIVHLVRQSRKES